MGEGGSKATVMQGTELEDGVEEGYGVLRETKLEEASSLML